MTECRNHFFLLGDLQDVDRVGTTIVQSEVVNTQVPSAIRYPASEIGVEEVYNELAREFVEQVPQECRDEYIGGQIIYGDKPDISNKEELKSARRIVQGGEKVHPRLKTVEDINGNHELLPNGTFAVGNLYTLLFFRKSFGGPGEYQDAVVNQQSGGSDQVLTKDYVIAEAEEALNHPGEAVHLSYSNWDHYHVGEDEGHSPWSDFKTVDQTFWPEVEQVNGLQRWHASLQYFEEGDERMPLEQDLHLSASRLGVYDTQGGETPVYHIGLDVDFLEDDSSEGAIYGHVSYITTRLVRAFMDARLAENPNAKFIIGSHYPMEDIQKAGGAGQPHHFGETILSDERVIAVIAAHRHRSDYKDLNDGGELAYSAGLMDPIHKTSLRKSPLMEITIPSMIDAPLGAVDFSLGVDKNKNLSIEFKSLKLDRETLRAEADRHVTEAVDAYAAYAVTSHKTWQSTADTRLQVISHKESSSLEKGALIGKGHTGLWENTGPVHDIVVARDSIPGAVLRAESFIEYFKWIIYEGLVDLGLTEQAELFKDAYKENLDDVRKLFLDGVARLRGDPKPGEPDRGKDDKKFMDKVREKIPFTKAPTPIPEKRLTGFTPEQENINLQGAESGTIRKNKVEDLDKVLDQLLASGSGVDRRHKLVARLVRQLLAHTEDLVRIYKDRVTTYVYSIMTGETDTKLSAQNKMFIDETWREARDVVRDFPSWTRAKKFALLASDMTGDLRDQYHGRAMATDAPDLIKITFDPQQNMVTYTDPIPPLTEAELSLKSQQLYDSFPERKKGELDEKRKVVEERYGDGLNWDLVTLMGLRGDPLSSTVATFTLGGQLHLTGPRDPFDATFMGAATLGHPVNSDRWLLGASAAGYFDILNRLSLGIYGEVGVDFQNGLYGAVGPDISLLDGTFNLSVLHRIQNLPEGKGPVKSWGPELRVDLFRIVKFLADVGTPGE